MEPNCQAGEPGKLEGELANQLNFIFWLDDGDNVLETGERILAQGPASTMLTNKVLKLADSTGNNLDNNSNPLSSTQEYKIGQAWCYGTLSENRVPNGQGVSPIQNSGITCTAVGTDNKSQTDTLKANITFYLEQSKNNSNFTCQSLVPVVPSANPSPSPTLVTYQMENKDGNWNPILDGTFGILTYEPEGPTFNYSFSAEGLTPTAGGYCLIYYADPWHGNGTDHSTGFLIDSGNSTGDGKLSLVGNKDIGTSLPNAKDENYPKGAKVWLVPCSNYNQTTHIVNDWTPANWLFGKFEDSWVHYTRTLPTPQSITINELGGDIGAQYGYNFNYSSANVNFAYTTPQASKLSGTINATGLKPYTSYQVKFSGIPTCLDAINGNNTTNENIGYKGRWTCTSCGGDANSRNRSDALYVANKAKADGDPTKECIAGYLVWDFFTADSSGNASQAVSTSNSYHVLFCGGGTCDTATNTFLNTPDSTHPTQKFCPADKVDGQLERGTCGGLTLDAGSYHLTMALTEESFHQGNWAVVLQKPIDFTIN